MTDLREALKQKLARRENVVGICATFNSTDLVAALAKRFAFIFIDCENAGPDVGMLPDMVRAAHAGGAVALVRPWSKEQGVLRRYLGCGIDGFILPDVESPDEVAFVRRLMRDTRPADHASLVLFTIIETVRGVERAAEIMQADVDAIQIGNSDLAVSMGLPRRGDHEEVRQIAFRIIGEAKALTAARGR